ncbi:helix-turn-helix domain-containing protein [Nocardia sp. NPDC004860]|uniref:helix-turn-helix transcriptional regulator n=1 Tax=Nocardia sp. NPDC004860 TaxID=3154557 RepID=UPI0033BEA3E8
MPNDTIWLTRAELSARTKLSEKTLRNWTAKGRGPRFSRFGGRVRYRLTDVVAWENQQDRTLARQAA